MFVDNHKTEMDEAQKGQIEGGPSWFNRFVFRFLTITRKTNGV